MLVSAFGIGMRAMTVAVSGLSVATIVGVPGGTALAQHTGTEAAQHLRRSRGSTRGHRPCHQAAA